MGSWHFAGMIHKSSNQRLNQPRIGRCKTALPGIADSALRINQYNNIMSQPVAVVTGAASGIGLAMTKHLLSKSYRVVMADVNAHEGMRISSELGPNTMFHQADVSSYAQQAAVISGAFAWGGNRLDFFAANAGIDDRQSLYQDNESTKLGAGGVPEQLNLKTLDVDLNAVIQGIWLFKYYARKNVGKKGGKIVVTSSAAGL